MSIPDETLAEPALLMRRICELDIVRLRSELLGRKDKVLMQMIFDKGGTFEQIARLTGQNPSTVSRRFHTLLQKLIARELVCLLRHREEFDKSAIRILQEYYLRGLSQMLSLKNSALVCTVSAASFEQHGRLLMTTAQAAMEKFKYSP